MPLTCADVDFDLKLAEFKINGYAVFEDMTPEEKIDRIREAFLPLLAHIQERETEVSNVELGDPRIGQGRLQTTNRDTGIAREIPHVGLETVPIVGVKFIHSALFSYESKAAQAA